MKGNLIRLPTIGVSVGISSIAEFQIDSGLYSRLNITERTAAPLSSVLTFTGNSTHDVEDTIVAQASAPGPGARAIIRLSGNQALSIAELSPASTPPSNAPW